MGRKSVTDKLKKKRDTVKQNERNASVREPLLTESADSFEERLDENILLHERKKAKGDRRKSAFIKVARILLVACSVYLAFLIYGVINTDYIYDAGGNPIPLVMTYNQIKKLEDFNRLAVQYRQARLLYEQVLVLDYRMAAGVESPMTIAPEYEKLLASIEPLAIQLSALTVPAEYTQTKNMLLTWTKNDIAVY